MVEAKTSNSVCGLIRSGANEKKYKFKSKGAVKESRDTFGIFGPLHIFGTVEARNFKFGTQIDHESC